MLRLFSTSDIDLEYLPSILFPSQEKQSGIKETPVLVGFGASLDHRYLLGAPPLPDCRSWECRTSLYRSFRTLLILFKYTPGFATYMPFFLRTAMKCSHGATVMIRQENLARSYTRRAGGSVTYNPHPCAQVPLVYILSSTDRLVL